MLCFQRRFPQLKLVADLSHFLCVAETNPWDETLTDAVSEMAPQVHHIHARIGYDHGPQVADPRAPEWESYVKGHERWWRKIWKSQKQQRAADNKQFVCNGLEGVCAASCMFVLIICIYIYGYLSCFRWQR